MLRRSDFIEARYAFSFVLANFGIAIAARMPMITTTIRSSISVKPLRVVLRMRVLSECLRGSTYCSQCNARITAWEKATCGTLGRTGCSVFTHNDLRELCAASERLDRGVNCALSCSLPRH